MGVFNYEEWLARVPESIKQDPLWDFQVYPKALLLSDLTWEDTSRMMKDPRGRMVARQLVDSVGSICANIEEGHGRGFGKENAYFQRVALGSARESRGWYYRGRRFLGPKVLEHRVQLLNEIVAALVLSSERQRQYRKR
ncbi:MAG: four helix bundle protein [Anaerolineales bacterium]|nr:MAG: four helix bundle protein [Anaerolineales bacterium]